MNSIQPYENRTHLVGLDFLHGWVIFMAIFEHYTGYLNYWYVDFFLKRAILWDIISFTFTHVGATCPDG